MNIFLLIAALWLLFVPLADYCPKTRIADMHPLLQLRLLAHTIDATTLSVPPRRRRSRGYGLPVSLGFLAVAGCALVMALTGAW